MNLTSLLSSVLFGAFVVVGSTANAASQCKGLSAAACAADSDCRWVESYVRKDGREVSAYCRLGKPATKTLGKSTSDRKLSASK
jgi:hypothetical protein